VARFVDLLVHADGLNLGPVSYYFFSRKLLDWVSQFDNSNTLEVIQKIACARQRQKAKKKLILLLDYS